MRKRHTAEQIAQALRHAEAGTPVADIIRKLGVHENTFYLWKRNTAVLGRRRSVSCDSFAKRT